MHKLLESLKKQLPTLYFYRKGIRFAIRDIDHILSGKNLYYAVDFSELYEYASPLQLFSIKKKNVDAIIQDIARNQKALMVAFENYWFGQFILFKPYADELIACFQDWTNIINRVRGNVDNYESLRANAKSGEVKLIDGLQSHLSEYNEKESDEAFISLLRYLHKNYVSHLNNVLLSDFNRVHSLYGLYARGKFPPPTILPHYIQNMVFDKQVVDKIIFWENLLNRYVDKRTKNEDIKRRRKENNKADAKVLALIEGITFDGNYPNGKLNDDIMVLFTHSRKILHVTRDTYKIPRTRQVESFDLLRHIIRDYDYFIVHGLFNRNPIVIDVGPAVGVKDNSTFLAGTSKATYVNGKISIPMMTNHNEIVLLVNILNRYLKKGTNKGIILKYLIEAQEKFQCRLKDNDDMIDDLYKLYNRIVDFVQNNKSDAIEEATLRQEYTNKTKYLYELFQDYENMEIGIKGDFCQKPVTYGKLEISEAQRNIVSRVRSLLLEKGRKELNEYTNNILLDIKHGVEQLRLFQKYIEHIPDPPALRIEPSKSIRGKAKLSLIFCRVRYWIYLTDKSVVNEIKDLVNMINTEEPSKYNQALESLRIKAIAEKDNITKANYFLVLMFLLLQNEEYNKAINLCKENENSKDMDLNRQFIIYRILGNLLYLDENYIRNEEKANELKEELESIKVNDHLAIEEDERAAFIYAGVLNYLMKLDKVDEHMVLEKLKNAYNLAAAKSKMRLMICNNIAFLIADKNMDVHEDLCIKSLDELTENEDEPLLDNIAVIDTIVVCRGWLITKGKDLKNERKWADIKTYLAYFETVIKAIKLTKETKGIIKIYDKHLNDVRKIVFNTMCS